MTAIVYLDIDDEITSAVARIRSLEAARIALVLPHGSRLATSRINFRLLAREATTRNKTLEIVTGDASARALAASAGLPTHVSVAAFESGSAGPVVKRTTRSSGESAGVTPFGGAAPLGPDGELDSPTVVLPAAASLPSPKPGTPTPQVGRKLAPRTRGRRLAAFLGAAVLLAALGVAGLQVLPSAAIVLRPSVDSVGPIALSITAQPGITQPDPIGLLVPAATFTFELEVSNTFPATGVKVVDTAAAGEVTFSSLNTGAPNTIAAGSIVKTESGIEFRTREGITLPPAQIGIVGGNFVVIPSTRQTGVDAVDPGVSGNVPAGSIVVVPERENAKRTIVTNDAPTSGGSHTESAQVQQFDLDAALLALDEALAVRFVEEIARQAGVPVGTTLFPETKTLGLTISSVDPATLLGTDATAFELGLSARGTVLGVDPGPVSTLADARLRSAVDRGFSLDEGSIKIEVGSPIVAGTTITFPVTVRALQVREVDVAGLLTQIGGLGLPQARTVLAEYGDATITVWPDWVTTIPTNPARVTLTLEGVPGASASPGAVASPAGSDAAP